MMRAFLFFLTLAGFLPLALRGELLERDYTGRYPQPVQRVNLDVVRGMIEVVNGSAGSEIVIETRLRVQGSGAGGAVARSEDAARPPSADLLARLFKRMAPQIKVRAHELNLRISDSQSVVFDWDPTLQMVIEVKVTLPPGLDLRVRNVAAGVTFTGAFKGNVDLRSEGGSIYAGLIDGDVVARTGAGSITVKEITGRSELRSDTGLVLAGRLRGPADLRTLNGAIEVQNAYRKIKMRGADAELVLGLSRPVSGDLDLATSAGRILINIDRNVALSVDAVSSMFGNVQVRGLELTTNDGVLRSSAVNGDLNGGGTLLRVRTTGGEIALVGRDPLEPFEPKEVGL